MKRPRSAPADQEPRDIDVELRAWRRVEQRAELALVTCRPEPTPIAQDVNVDALRKRRAFAHECRTGIGPGGNGEFEHRRRESCVVGCHGFVSDAYAVAALELALEAWPGATPVETETAPAQPMFGCERTQRLARGLLRNERTERSRQRAGLDGSGRNVCRRG